MTFGLLPLNDDSLPAPITLEKTIAPELANRAAKTARGPRRGQPGLLRARWPGRSRDPRRIDPRRLHRRTRIERQTLRRRHNRA